MSSRCRYLPLVVWAVMSVALRLEAQDPPSPVLTLSTLLGGSGNDTATELATDAAGNVYVVGDTSSWDFPCEGSDTAPDLVGGRDVVVVKLGPELDEILAVSTLGGPGDDMALDLDVKADGRCYVVGRAAAGFPTTDGSPHSGGVDTFLAVFDEALELESATLIGGSGDDMAVRMHLMSEDTVAIVGYTTSRSPSFPVTDGAFQTAYGGGQNDAFLMKVRTRRLPDLASRFVYSTYLGGSGLDGRQGSLYGMDVIDGPDGSLTVVGETASHDFPGITTSACQGGPRGGIDVFVVLLDCDADLAPSQQLIYGTYLGGGADESPKQAAWVDDATVALTGWTYSGDFPKTGAVPHRGSNDAFVSLLRPDLDAAGVGAEQLVFSATFGGSLWDTPKELRATSEGNLLIAGRTASGNFPTSGPVIAPFRADWNQGFVCLYRPDPDLAPEDRFLFSSSLGGGSTGANDYVRGLTPEASGLWLTCGHTGSPSFPVTPGVIQPTHGGGERDMFLARLDLRFPTVRLETEPAWGPAPLDVAFDASGSTPAPGTEVASVSWDFGDGDVEASGELGASHRYEKPGRYIATLTVEGDNGLPATEAVEITAALRTLDVGGWRGTDIGVGPDTTPVPIAFPGGSQPVSGGATGDFVMAVGGLGIGGRADRFFFIEREVEGDFVVETEIDAVEGADSSAYIGVMARATLDADSPHVSILGRPLTSRWSAIARSEPGGTTRTQDSRGGGEPFRGRIRLARSGDSFSASHFDEASGAWMDLELDPAELPAAMPAAIHVGVCAVKRDRVGTGRSAFEPLRAEVRGLRVTNGPVAPRFVRGDSNDDGAVNLSDAVHTLGWLFAGGPASRCLASANVNHDVVVNVADPVYLLNHLFLGGPEPRAPYPGCGESALAADAELGCEDYASCR